MSWWPVSRSSDVWQSGLAAGPGRRFPKFQSLGFGKTFVVAWVLIVKPRLLYIVLHVEIASFVIVKWTVLPVPIHVYFSPVDLRVVPSVSSFASADYDNIVFSALIQDAVSIAFELIMEVEIPCSF